jgi:sucrose phosphorylase
LVPPSELERLVETIHRNSGGSSRLATGAAASNLDLYQVNCTFYDALARSDRDYLLARLLQLFVPGVPQIYYVGLLAGENDLALLARSGAGRDINRHYYRHDDVLAALRRPVVANLCALIRLRNTHPAFGGTFSVEESADTELVMRWQNGAELALLAIDFGSGGYRFTVSAGGTHREIDLLALAESEDPRAAAHRAIPVAAR